eukprot:8018609-Heterocapsa_arctica.AAC.1
MPSNKKATPIDDVARSEIGSAHGRSQEDPQSEGTKPEGESEERILDGTQDHNHSEEASGSGPGPAGGDRNFEGNKTDLRKPDKEARGGRTSTPDEVAQSEPEAGS